MFLINLLLCMHYTWTELFTTCFPDKHYGMVVVIGLIITKYSHHIYQILCRLQKCWEWRWLCVHLPYSSSCKIIGLLLWCCSGFMTFVLVSEDLRSETSLVCMRAQSLINLPILDSILINNVYIFLTHVTFRHHRTHS